MALKKFIKENPVLVIGLTLPILLIAIFFVAIVLPKSMAVPPQYEMLFTTTRHDYQNPPLYNVDFFVKNEKLKTRVSKNVRDSTHNNYQNYNRKKLMVYDGKNQSVREISYDISGLGDIADGTEIVFNEFKNMKIDDSTKAPDDYEFDNTGYRSGGIALELFSGGYHRSNSRVTKGAVSFKIPKNIGNYSHNVQFVGWILQK